MTTPPDNTSKTGREGGKADRSELRTETIGGSAMFGAAIAPPPQVS